MRSKLPKLLVTGGAGFIGSAFVRLAVKKGYRIALVDKITYAGDLKRLGQALGKVEFYKIDICRAQALEKVFLKERPQAVVNFAAETHVDRSISEPASFVETNFKGAETVYSLSRKYRVRRFIQISTDEVYGEILKGRCSEGAPLAPSSPYSAAKAAADLLLQAYNRTYDFPGIIVRPSNTYGPWQYPEKFIPLSVLKVLTGKKVPVYARGENIREWLYVDDCVNGIMAVLEQAKPQAVYNLGSGQNRCNLEVVKKLLGLLKAGRSGFEFVSDRPGHDLRYCLNSCKVKNDTGWRPCVTFDRGLRQTVDWCRQNRDWLYSKLPNLLPLNR